MKNYFRRYFEWPMCSIPVHRELNPFALDGVELFAVPMWNLPYGSHKFITVYGLIRDARRIKKIMTFVHTLVEATSGNTGVALGYIANTIGVGVKLIVPPDLPDGKRHALLLTGAELVSPQKGLSAIATARKLGGGGWRPDDWGADDGCLNLDQYANPAGASLHRDFTGVRILELKPTVLVSPIGTGGMVVGVSERLKKDLNDAVNVWGVLCKPGQEIPGCRDENRMKEIRLPWRQSLDQLTEIPTKPSYLASLWLGWKMGITPGPSGGFAYLGALKLLGEYKAQGKLDLLRNKEGSIRVVILFPDGNGLYGDRFTANLPADYFSKDTAPLPWKFPGNEL